MRSDVLIIRGNVLEVVHKNISTLTRPGDNLIQSTQCAKLSEKCIIMNKQNKRKI